MDVVAVVLATYVLGSVAFTCALLTGLSALRRGSTPVHSALAAVSFPLTWALWFVLDEPAVSSERVTA